MRRERPTLFKRRQFEAEIIVLCVRWYLRYPLSFRQFEEIMAERNLSVDHVTIWRWVQCYAPELNRRCRPHCGIPTGCGGSMKRIAESPASGLICIARWIRPATPSTFS